MFRLTLSPPGDVPVTPAWPCLTVYSKVLSERLMLNVTNETVWTCSAHKVPGALGTDHCGYGLDGMLCAFVVSWRLTTPDIIRSQRRSKPWATAFAPHLIIPQHYSGWGLWNMHYPIWRSPLSPPTQRWLYELIHTPNKVGGPLNTCYRPSQRGEATQQKTQDPFLSYSWICSSRSVRSAHKWKITFPCM